MSYEKSCGAIIFYREEDIKFLLIFNKKGNSRGHWGFPKGHVEGNESEVETAKREIYEETGLSPEFIKGFRTVSRYSPKPGVIKDAVYFLAESKEKSVSIQESEISEFKWCSFKEALKIITFDKKYLEKAKKFIDNNI